MNHMGKDGGRAARPVRVEDVAREAGVSPITVSRALSAPHKVRPETRERVMAAVLKTGYVVNSIASSLRSGRSSTVTVFVASLLNPHFAAAMQGALDAFEGSRFRLMQQRGRWIERDDGGRAFATVHPSYLLRLRGEEARAQGYAEFVRDLALMREV